MPPTPPNTTDRYFLDYSTCGHDHTLIMRVETSIDETAASTKLDAFLGAMPSLFHQITIIGLRFQEAGTNISLPRTWSGATTYGGSGGQEYETAQFLDFVGRGLDGTRVRVAVFGCTFSEQGNNFRVTRVEQAEVGDAIDILNADLDYFQCVTGSQAVYYDYANSGQNAYWRNRIR